MRLTQLRFLLALKKYKTFSKTAKELMVSQPSISKAIKELEDEVGFEILSRGRNGVEFTQLGKITLEKAEIIIQEIENISLLKYSLLDTLNGKIAVGCSPFFSNGIVLDVMLEIQKTYPNIQMTIRQDDSGKVMKHIILDEITLGVILMHEGDSLAFRNEFIKNDLRFVELFQDQLLFIVGKEHPLLKQGEITINAIMNYTYITYKDIFSDYTLTMLKKYGYNKDIISINDWDSIRRFAILTNGFFVVPKFIFNETFNHNDDFVAVTISDFKWVCTVGWVHKNKVLSEIEQLFVNHLISRCTQYK